jgi:7,8-dihydropterin-6-yl-methyl-4-(beta-D-ribofuranosyl)aminobenzene 5'-phosphate synthase
MRKECLGIVILTFTALTIFSVSLLQASKRRRIREVHLVLGGFHLSGASENMILSIIEQFRELGVEKVAPCHCSGDRARALFKTEFGKDM